MQHGLYKRFAYAISVRSLGHGGGRPFLGIFLKPDIQTGLDELFVRTLRKVLLVHDTRSRSIGWTREKICNVEGITVYAVGGNGIVTHLIQYV